MLDVFGRVGDVPNESDAFRDRLLAWGKPTVALISGFGCAVVSAGITVPFMAGLYDALLFSAVLSSLIPFVLAAPTTWFIMSMLERVAASEVQQRALAEELTRTLEEASALRGMLPICSSCKNMRDDGGYWHTLETFIASRSDADFTHSICPDCMHALYPDIAEEIAAETASAAP